MKRESESRYEEAPAPPGGGPRRSWRSLAGLGFRWVECVFELVWVNLPGPLQPFIPPAGRGGALIPAQGLIGGVEEAQAPSLSGV